MVSVGRLFLVFGVCILSGCIKYYKLSDDEFPQTKSKRINKNIIAENVRSVRVYNQFSTVANFDALWMSDAMREYYAHVNGKRHGKSQEAIERLAQKEQAHNTKETTFYVLAYLPEGQVLLDTVMPRNLAEKDSGWSLYLENNQGVRVEPTQIKEVELDTEIRFFFGYRLTQFKKAYKVVFPITDEKKRVVIDGDDPHFKLVASSVIYDVNMHWGSGTQEELGKPVTRRAKRKDVTINVKSQDKKNEYEYFYWL